jgi:hypothetical protein
LEKLPAGNGGLTALREIDLSGCRSLKNLPGELGALKELQKINLSGCSSWERLPAGIGVLTALREINLSGCESLRKLPAELGALKELQKIYLFRCKSLEKVPSELGVLIARQEMELSECESLTEVPAELGTLTTLREIDFSYCKSLKELPAVLGALTQLQEIRLYGFDAMHKSPPHVVEQGTGAVLEFLRDLAKGDAPCHLIKVVLLGNQRAGKSSLADSLVLGRPAIRADSDGRYPGAPLVGRQRISGGGQHLRCCGAARVPGDTRLVHVGRHAFPPRGAAQRCRNQKSARTASSRTEGSMNVTGRMLRASCVGLRHFQRYRLLL